MHNKLHLTAITVQTECTKNNKDQRKFKKIPYLGKNSLAFNKIVWYSFNEDDS